MLDIDKVDIEILGILYSEEKISPLYSIQVKDVISKFSYETSYYTIVRRFQKLIEKGYALEGYKCRNAKAYYLSDKGICFYKEEIIEKEDADISIKINNEGEI